MGQRHLTESESQIRDKVATLSNLSPIFVSLSAYHNCNQTLWFTSKHEREVLSSFLNLWRGENHTKFREISLEKVPENFYSPVLGKPGKRTVNDFRISKGTSFPCESSGLTGCFGHSQNRYPHERRGARYHQNVMHVPSSSPHAMPSPQPDSSPRIPVTRASRSTANRGAKRRRGGKTKSERSHHS